MEREEKMSQGAEGQKSTARPMAQSVAKYRKPILVLGIISTVFAVCVALFAQEWLWFSLGLVGMCLTLVGVALQIRDLANHLKTRDRRHEQLAARLENIEHDIAKISTSSADLRSGIAVIDAVYSKMQEYEMSAFDRQLPSGQTEGEIVTAASTVAEPDQLRISTFLKANSGKKTLFLGSHEYCHFVEKLAQNIPELDIDTVVTDQVDAEVVTTIGQYELLLVWLPPIGEPVPILPFSWISNAAKVFIGPAKTARAKDIQRLNYGTPVTLVIEKELDNLLAVKAVRSIED